MIRGDGGLLPALACDTHSHVYGDPKRFPVEKELAQDSGLDEYLEVSRKLGAERHVLVQAKAYGCDNRWLLEAIGQIGLERSRGIVFATSLPQANLSQLHSHGIRGIRFLYDADARIDTSAVLDSARRIAPLGWSILIQGPALTVASALEDLSAAECPIVIDHMGRIPAEVEVSDNLFQLFLRFLKKGGWVKVSAPYYGVKGGSADFFPLRHRLDAFLDAAGDRAIWGVNWPHPNLPQGRKPDEAASLRSLISAIPDPAKRKMLFVDNPSRLYGFTPPT